ncbi:unnamed protein product [Moneuplotes crassus]|uniref:Uncharacterized protein n=1 Tax=Euplotes crassus TaxID=5936 RepID=A0AAD1XF60_EUPCR|nr:unnamed protein product [Moneuplotes crassus]
MNADLDSKNIPRVKRTGKAKTYHCLFVSCIIGGIIALFAAIFMPIAINAGLGKKIDAKILLKESEIEYWGHTPGNYNIDSTENYKVFGYPTKEVTDLLSVETAGDHSFNVEKKYEKISYSVIEDTITFEQTQELKEKDKKVNEAAPYLLNLGAFSTNYLLSDKENFKEIYSLLKDSAEQMIENLVPYVFSMNAYYTAMNDKNIVTKSVLAGIKNSEAIFSDEEMGFGSIKSLSKWIRAIEGGATSDMYKSLQSHFSLKDAQMDQIVGTKSFLKALYSATQVSFALQYNCRKACDNTTMFAIQWSSQNVTNLQDTFISPKVKAVESLYDLDNSLFGARPEFSYALAKNNISAEALNLTQALRLASIASFDDSASIFNPTNLYLFFSSYLTESYDNIKIKFKLVSNEQCDAIYKYLIDYVIPKLGNYEDKKGTKQHKSFANLVTHAIQKTEQNLGEFLYYELFSRYIGAALIKDKKKCTDFVSKGVEKERAEAACAKVPFDKYEGTTLWSKAFMLGPESDLFQHLSQVTNLTTEELEKVFSTSSSKNYGGYANSVIQDISKQLKCSNKPCSKEELAHRQFMSAGITSKIVKYGGVTDFLQEAESVKDWNYDKEVAMEYPYLAKNKCEQEEGISEETYKLLTSGDHSLTLYKNAINFVIDVDQGVNLSNYTEMYKTDAAKLFCTMRYMVQDSLLGGILIRKDSLDFINGYEDDILSILREGDFSKGSDPSVQTHVSINDVYYNRTLIEDVTLELFTGNRHPEKVKSARSINGGVYINNVIPYFNGTNITYGNLNPYQTNIRLEGTDGLQFGKNLGKGSKPKYFDVKKIQDVQYKYVDTKSFDDINTLKYDLDQDSLQVSHEDNEDRLFNYNGIYNISHTFKLPLGSSAGYFKGVEGSTYGSVKIDGKEPSSMHGNVENFFSIEPVSGFTIDSKRNEMLAIDVHEKYLTFPDLDKVTGFIPLMNSQAEVKINEQVFLNKYGFVNSYVNGAFYFRVIGFPLAGLLLLAAGAFFFLYTRYREKNESYSVMSDSSFKNEQERLVEHTDKNPEIKERYEETKDIQDSTRLDMLDEDEGSP